MIANSEGTSKCKKLRKMKKNREKMAKPQNYTQKWKKTAEFAYLSKKSGLFFIYAGKDSKYRKS